MVVDIGMLQTNKAKSEINRELATTEIVSGAETLQLFVSFVRRQFPVIVFCLLLTVALGGIYIITARPSFTAQAQLLIDARKVQVFQQQSILGDIPIDTAQVESQVEVLKSENVALAVIKNLHLIEDPEFVGSGGGLVGTLIGFVISPFASDQATSQVELNRRAVRAFQDRLTVKRVGLTYVIQISFRSYDAERAAQIANAIADSYIVDQLEAKYQATRRASVWLQDRIKELREQVSKAERAVVEFRAKHNIVSTGGSDKRLIGEQQVAEINSQLVIARAHTAETRARLDRIEAVLKADSPSASVDATVADTLKNEVVTKLRTQYLELSARESDWSARYGRDHLAAVNLRNQLREIRNSIFQELKRLGETYKSDYEIAKQREDGIQKELAQAVSQSQTTDTAQIALRELESTSQTYRTLYDNFLQRYMESVQQQSFPITEARLISPASRPLHKSHPQTLLILAITGCGGMILGFGVAVLRDLSDRVFRTNEQVESLLQADCLALVPLLTGDDVRHVKASKPAGPRAIARDDKAVWAAVDDAPFSRFAETMRSIKLAVDLNGVIKSNRVIGFTSSQPNEGKSTVATALAQLMSQVNTRTILVDCDLRNPSLSRALAPAAETGLLDVIAGKASLEEAIWKDPSTNMAFLPAVVKSRLPHSNEILGSDPTKKLFEQLRERYDYVVVDLSPLAPVVDVQATTHLVDSFIFVIEWGRTKIDIVEHALSNAPGVFENLLGVVLNKVDMNVFGRYASHREGYYYNKHYERYGYME